MKIMIYIFFFSGLVMAQDLSSSCFRFRVHLKAELPKLTNKHINPLISKELLYKIQHWENDLNFLKDKNQKEVWLNCVNNFLAIDTDGDGIGDWTAIVDGMPSRILYPLDDDIDGDGIINLLDEDPYKANVKKVELIPSHLRHGPDTFEWQKKIQKSIGIIVVNHTDDHHPDVLKTFFEVTKMFPFKKIFKKGAPKVLYAMKGRNPFGQIASYHPSANAIALPGKSSYGKSLSRSEICHLTSAIIHEIGHFYLINNIHAAELIRIANGYGSWNFIDLSVNDIWDKKFHGPYGGPLEFVSIYATTNVHEWFAEHFAAYVWKKNQLNDGLCSQYKEEKIPISFFNWFDLSLI